MLRISNTKHNKIVTHTATFAKGNIRYGWVPPYYFFDDKKYQKKPLVNTLFQHRIKIIDLIFLTSRFYQTHFQPHVYRLIRTLVPSGGFRPRQQYISHVLACLDKKISTIIQNFHIGGKNNEKDN